MEQIILGSDRRFCRLTMMIPRILLLLVTLAVASCSGPKTNPKDAAVEFFQKCASGNSAAAYQSASKVFQLERSQKYFEARVRDLGLDRVKSVEWSEPEARGETQRVRGKFSLNDDKTINLVVAMVQENGEWRLLGATQTVDDRIDDVFAVVARTEDSESDRKRAFVEPVDTAMPSDRQLQQLVETTLIDFHEAIQADEFAGFFATVSDRWKYRGKDPRALNYAGTDPRRLQESDPMNRSQRLTVEALKREFHPFVAAKVDLSPIKGKKLILDPPAYITSDGVLTLQGHYKEFVFQGGFPAQPRRLSFKLEYVFEGSSWKLFGITLNVVPPEGLRQ